MSAFLRSCVPCCLLLAVMAPAGAIEFFTDDFEEYFTDEELVDFGDWRVVDEANPPESTENCVAGGGIFGATWTVTNPFARANPATENGAPSTGFFLISDSDGACGANLPGTGQSHDVWTPEFETLGSDTVWLHFDASLQLNNNGECVFDVDVTTDGGDTWSNAFRRIAPARTAAPFPTRNDADGYYGRIHVDLSEFAANAAAVRLRFRHFEPNDDWFVAIDNVVVDDVTASRGGARFLLAPTTFDAGIPADWQVISQIVPPNEGDKTWTTGDPGGRFTGGVTERGANRLDPPFAILDSDVDPDPPEDEFLLTPTIDCSPADDVFLHFSDEIVVTGAIQEVLVSLDGGATFEGEPVFSYSLGALVDTGEEPFYHERVLQVPAAAGESEVVFAFHYSGGGNQWWWAVDDIAVSANGDIPITCADYRVAAEFDPEAVEVTVSWIDMAEDAGYRVLRDGEAVSEDLPAGTGVFVDTEPVGRETTYSLQVLDGADAVTLTCEAAAICPAVPPADLVCCADQEAGTIELSWTGGVNIAGAGYAITRDGTPLAVVPFDESSFVDDTLDGPGAHVYELTVADNGCVEPLGCAPVLSSVRVEPFGDLELSDCGSFYTQFDFNGDLTSTTGARDLVAEVALPLLAGIDEPGVTFETAEINGEEAMVARYSRGTYFRLFTGFPANGGGGFTNQFTIIMDVMFPVGALDESGWAGLFQSSTTNSNDGEWYVQNSSRGIGISGNYGGTIVDDTWHRVALVVDLVEGSYTSYIDGEQVQQNRGLALDGRFALYTVNAGELEGMLIFADDNSENSGGLVNSVQVSDQVVSPDVLRQIGGASADGIPLPLPLPSCPTDVICRTDQQAQSITLEWSLPPEIQGTGLRILRNGLPVRTVPITETTFVDDNLPGPGRYDYQVSLLGSDCPPLTCTGVVIDGAFAFFDDFDSYRDDDEMVAAGWAIVDENEPLEESTWTLTDPLDRGVNPPTVDGSPAFGNFLISDSDFGGTNASNPSGTGMSHDVWSPTIDCSELSTVWLHMDASGVLNNNGLAVFDVDVTTDGGGSWTNVFRRVAPARTDFEPVVTVDIPDGLPGGPQVGNADGFYGRLDIDLTEQAAGESNVRIRLRHFEPNWDWWVAIDNFLVDSRPALGGNQTLLEPEAFTDGIPDDWLLESEGDGVAPWRAEDICLASLLNFNGGVFPDNLDGRRLHHFDETFAIVSAHEPDGVGGCFPALCLTEFCQDEILGTPIVDCTEATNVYLHVKSSLFATPSTAEILLSLDGGLTFEPDPIFSYHAGGLLLRDAGNAEVVYNEYVFEVPRAAGQDEVLFAFRFTNPTGIDGFWALDDVMITADVEGEGVPYVRGDTNSDGSINLSDGVNILNVLFLGIGEIACDAAADTNGDGSINLSDGVNVLNVLFLGIGGIPAPAACGDELAEIERCASFPPCE